MTASVALVDYNMGNLHSLAKAVEQVGGKPIIVSQPDELASCDRVILPGVGSIAPCMDLMVGRDFGQALQKLGKPVLGICLGMQALSEGSEENGGIECLGWMSGHSAKMSPTPNRRIPHMGWNSVWQKQPHPLWQDIPDGTRFYFAHSYSMNECNATLAVCDYGEPFVAAAGRDFYFTTQFHPEKSHDQGLRLIANFMAWNP